MLGKNTHSNRNIYCSGTFRSLGELVYTSGELLSALSGLGHEHISFHFFLPPWENITFLDATAVPGSTRAHLKGDAGLFVEVDLSDDSPCVLLHVKDAAAVGRPVQVHSIADQTGWGTLEGEENYGKKKKFSETAMLK